MSSIEPRTSNAKVQANQEHTGIISKQLSSTMRTMCLMSLIFAIALTTLHALGKTATGFDTNLILYFLGGAFGGKAIQKAAERGQDQG